MMRSARWSRRRGSSRSSRPVDPIGRVGGGGRRLDPHRAPLVVPPLDEPGLVEQADEDTGIAVGQPRAAIVSGSTTPPAARTTRYAARRSSSVGTSPRANARRAFASAAPASRRVSAGCAVAAGAADHLDVALERVRVVDEGDEPDVGLVDAHPERGGRDDDLQAVGEERLLHVACARRARDRRGRPRRAGRARGARGDRLRRPARAGVDDGRAASDRAQPLEQRARGVRPRSRPPRRRSGGSAGRRSCGPTRACRPRASPMSASTAGVAVAVSPSTVGSPRAARARRMKR